jgi:hypothetical protein
MELSGKLRFLILYEMVVIKLSGIPTSNKLQLPNKSNTPYYFEGSFMTAAWLSILQYIFVLF